MEKQYKIDILEMLGNYGQYVCNVGSAMDKAGISISKMRRLTGLNHEIVKKYYEDRIVRIESKFGVAIANKLRRVRYEKRDKRQSIAFCPLFWLRCI